MTTLELDKLKQQIFELSPESQFYLVQDVLQGLAKESSGVSKPQQALRKYRAEEIAGIVHFDGVLLSVAEEKDVLMDALLEKYG